MKPARFTQALLLQCATYIAALSGTSWQLDAHAFFLVILATCSIMASVPALVACCAAIVAYQVGLGFTIPALVWPTQSFEETSLRVAIHVTAAILTTSHLLRMTRIRRRLRKAGETHRDALALALDETSLSHRQKEVERARAEVESRRAQEALAAAIDRVPPSGVAHCGPDGRRQAELVSRPARQAG